MKKYIDKPDFEIPIRYPLSDNHVLFIDGVSNHLSLIKEGLNIRTIEQWGFDEFPHSSTIMAILAIICEKYQLKVLTIKM